MKIKITKPEDFKRGDKTETGWMFDEFDGEDIWFYHKNGVLKRLALLGCDEFECIGGLEVERE